MNSDGVWRSVRAVVRSVEMLYTHSQPGRTAAFLLHEKRNQHSSSIQLPKLDTGNPNTIEQLQYNRDRK